MTGHDKSDNSDRLSENTNKLDMTSVTSNHLNNHCVFLRQTLINSVALKSIVLIRRYWSSLFLLRSFQVMKRRQATSDIFGRPTDHAGCTSQMHENM